MRRNDRILLNHFAKATDEIRNFIKGMDFSEFVENARTRKAAAFNDATTGDILNRLKRSSPDPGEFCRRPRVRELIDRFAGRGLELCRGHPCGICE